MGRRIIWASLASLVVHWGLFQIGWSVKPQERTRHCVQHLELLLLEPSPEKAVGAFTQAIAQVEPRASDGVHARAALPPSSDPKARLGRQAVRPARSVDLPTGGPDSAPMSTSLTGVPEAMSGSHEGGGQGMLSVDTEEGNASDVGRALGDPPVEANTGPRPRGVQRAVPRYDLNPRPEYPEVARRRGYEGIVVVTARVLRDGTTADVRVGKGSGHEVLDEAAVEAVRSWRFVPGRVDEEPVDMEVDIPIRFQLR